MLLLNDLDISCLFLTLVIYSGAGDAFKVPAKDCSVCASVASKVWLIVYHLRSFKH